MKKLYLLTMLICVLCSLGLHAQVTTDPTPLQEDSQGVWIYFHADQGNKGLMGVAPPTEIYAHTGVITNKSTSDTDWKYAPTWGKNEDKYKLEWVEPNLWKLYIGNIRTYYGVPETETIEKLAFVFRNGSPNNGSYKEGKTSDSKDIMVPVLDSGLQIAMQTNPAVEVIAEPTNVTITVSTTMAADITLSVNDYIVQTASNTQTLTFQYYVTEPGDYNVVATASANGEEVSTSGTYVLLGPAIQMAYPSADGVPVMGPVTNPDGSVTFCVAAPLMSNMMIVGSWNDFLKTSNQQMYYTDYYTINPAFPNIQNYAENIRYFWTTISSDFISDPNENYLYYFIVNGTIPTTNGGSETVTNNVGDPYARLILDPQYDRELTSEVFENLPAYPWDYVPGGVPVAVYCENMNVYDWQCNDFVLPDKDNLIIYELLFRDFTGTEGKAEGNGTVRQAMERIPYLKQLGVNAIEVLPICEFNGNKSWGYNPNFYFAPDKAYGSPDDYKAFIDLCHQNGMAVILDMVFNQSDWLHPWYQMYGGVANSPMYNSAEDGYIGDNGAPHAYSVLNDWNQQHPLVQQQWTDVIKYWLEEYHFDGYRFDLVKGLGTNDSYGNATSESQLKANTERYNQSRITEMAYLNSVIQGAKEGGYCINENLAGASEETVMGEDGELCWAIVNWAACQFAMGYPYDTNGGGATNMNRLYAPKDGNRPWGSTVSFLESHDEDRMAWKQSMYAPAAIKNNPTAASQRLASAAAQMIMTPGSHMIWQYGELGLNEDITADRIGNKVVQFNTLYNNPVNRSIYDSYSQLIEIRFRNPQFFTEGAKFTINCTTTGNAWPANGYLLYSITNNGQELITAINPNTTGGNLAINYDFIQNTNNSYKILSQSYESDPSYNVSSKTISVPANCYVVIGNVGLNEAGVDDILAEDASQALQVYGDKGRIVVDYAANGATVYSLDGKVIGSVAESGEVAVASGLYIVKSGNKSVKIVVR